MEMETYHKESILHKFCSEIFISLSERTVSKDVAITGKDSNKWKPEAIKHKEQTKYDISLLTLSPKSVFLFLT